MYSAAFPEERLAVLNPLVEHGPEAVFAGQPNSLALLLAICPGIGVPGWQRTGRIAKGACFLKASLWVAAWRHILLLASPVVTVVPVLACGRGDCEGEIVDIADGVSLAGRPGGSISESAILQLLNYESGLDACLAGLALLATIRKAPHSYSWA